MDKGTGQELRMSGATIADITLTAATDTVYATSFPEWKIDVRDIGGADDYYFRTGSASADGAEGIINFVETGDDFDEIIVEQSRARSDDDALQLGKGGFWKTAERKSHIQMELLSVSRLLERAAHLMPTTLSLLVVM